MRERRLLLNGPFVPRSPIPSPVGDSVDHTEAEGAGGTLNPIVGEVLHLDCLSDEQLGLPPLLVLDGLVDVHDLFTNVLVYFGQSLCDFSAVRRLLRHSVVETFWGGTKMILKKVRQSIYIYCPF